MQPSKLTAESYIEALPADRREPMAAIRNVINENLPHGFSEGISYGMIGWTVPKSIFPAGYHCDPKLPLPFLNLASQKNFIALYHMGMYSSPELLEWFVSEFPKHSKYKLDMGKSCIRFKKLDDLPYKLIGELASKMSPEEWVALYQKSLR